MSRDFHQGVTRLVLFTSPQIQVFVKEILVEDEEEVNEASFITVLHRNASFVSSVVVRVIWAEAQLQFGPLAHVPKKFQFGTPIAAQQLLPVGLRAVVSGTCAARGGLHDLQGVVATPGTQAEKRGEKYVCGCGGDANNYGMISYSRRKRQEICLRF